MEDWRRYAIDEYEGETAAEAVDRLTRKYMSQHPDINYQQAFHVVLADPENAELKRDYAAY